MTEYIKREDAILAITRNYDEALSVADAIENLDEVPAADVVEIKKEGEWEMFDLISSIWYGKGLYFKQDNDMVYSRHSGEYMTVDEAIREFISLIDEENIACVPSVTTTWADGEAPTYVLQKHGKWELVGTTKLYEAGLYVDDEIEEKCSLCGCHTFRYETQKKSNFCPNCGADMRGREDERTD